MTTTSSSARREESKESYELTGEDGDEDEDEDEEEEEDDGARPSAPDDERDAVRGLVPP